MEKVDNGLLSYDELVELVERGIITNVDHDQINAASIDLTLGRDILIEQAQLGPRLISLRDRAPMATIQHDLSRAPFDMVPGQFILAQSQQVFNLPLDISAEYKLKSSMARIGLEHLTAGWCDAGWNGSVLTLELKNLTNAHIIRLHEGDRIGQIVFFRHKPVPADRSYAARGRYNNDLTVKGMKP